MGVSVERLWRGRITDTIVKIKKTIRYEAVFVYPLMHKINESTALADAPADIIPIEKKPSFSMVMPNMEDKIKIVIALIEINFCVLLLFIEFGLVLF